MAIRARKGIAVVISHRHVILGAVDTILALEAQRLVAFGPKEMVLQKLARSATGAVHVLSDSYRSLPERRS